MKKIFNYLYILIIVSIVNILNCNAECSYQERKDLLNKAKSVSITVEPKVEIVETTGTTSFSEEEVTIKSEKYSFDFIVSGLEESLYIRYYNSLTEDNGHIYYTDLEKDIYKFNIDNVSDIITFYFELYSLNENCPGEKFYTNRVVKPMYNYFSEYSVCQNELISSQEYCKKFITKKLNLTEEELYEKANKVIEESSKKVEDSNFNLLEFIKNYWYIFVGAILVVVIVCTVIIIKKKREKLL